MVISKSSAKKLLISLLLTINIQSHAGITDYWDWLWQSKARVALGVACVVGAVAAFTTWRLWNNQPNDTNGDDTDDNVGKSARAVEVSVPLDTRVERGSVTASQQQSEDAHAQIDLPLQQVAVAPATVADDGKAQNSAGATANNQVVAMAATVQQRVPGQQPEKHKVEEAGKSIQQAVLVHEQTLVTPVAQSSSSAETANVIPAVPVKTPPATPATAVVTPANSVSAETSASTSSSSAAPPSTEKSKSTKKKKKKKNGQTAGAQVPANGNSASSAQAAATTTSSSAGAADKVTQPAHVDLGSSSSSSSFVKDDRKKAKTKTSPASSSSNSKRSAAGGELASGKVKTKRKVVDIKKLKECLKSFISSYEEIELGSGCKHTFVGLLCMRKKIKNNPSVGGDFYVTDEYFITCRAIGHNDKVTTLGELEEKIKKLVNNKQVNLSFDKEEIFAYVDNDKNIQENIDKLLSPNKKYG